MSEAANSALRDDSVRLRMASLADAEALARLVNAAFRVEQPFIEGDRTNHDGVRSYMKKGKFLLAEDAAGLAGCEACGILCQQEFSFLHVGPDAVMVGAVALNEGLLDAESSVDQAREGFRVR